MKKIFCTGIALFSVIPSVFANTEENLTLNSPTPYGVIDNRETPMARQLGTVEDQYPRSPVYTNNGNILDTATLQARNFQANQEMWRNFHCEMLSRGFVWSNPINNFANSSVCKNVKITSSGNFSDIQRLEYQRKLVLEHIAKLKNSGQNQNAENSQKFMDFTVTEWKKFVREAINAPIEVFINGQSDTETIKNTLKKINDSLVSSPNIPENIKFASYAQSLRKWEKYSVFQEEFKKYEAIQKLLNLYENVNAQDIAFVMLPNVFNDNIIVETKNGQMTAQMYEQEIPIFIFDKNGEIINDDNFTIEYKNFPTYLKPKTTMNFGNRNFSLSFVQTAENINATTFEMIFTHKITQQKFVKKFSITPRTGEKTELVSSLTPKEISEITQNP